MDLWKSRIITRNQAAHISSSTGPIVDLNKVGPSWLKWHRVRLQKEPRNISMFGELSSGQEERICARHPSRHRLIIGDYLYRIEREQCVALEFQYCRGLGGCVSNDYRGVAVAARELGAPKEKIFESGQVARMYRKRNQHVIYIWSSFLIQQKSGRLSTTSGFMCFWIMVSGAWIFALSGHEHFAHT